MIKLLIPGALTATILLWNSMWTQTTVFVVLYALMVEIFRRLASYEKRFGDLDKIRYARNMLRKARRKIFEEEE